MENNETTPKSIPEVEDKETTELKPTTQGIKSYISLSSKRGVIINLLIVVHKQQENNYSRKVTAVATEIISDCLGESFLEYFFEKEKETGSHTICVVTEFGDDGQGFDICIDELNYDEFKQILNLKFVAESAHLLLIVSKTLLSKKEGS